MERGLIPRGKSVIEHLVFLLEEPSAQDFLTRILIGIVPDEGLCCTNAAPSAWYGKVW